MKDKSHIYEAEKTFDTSKILNNNITFNISDCVFNKTLKINDKKTFDRIGGFSINKSRVAENILHT